MSLFSLAGSMRRFEAIVARASPESPRRVLGS
jgi:hypothetical protein